MGAHPPKGSKNGGEVIYFPRDPGNFTYGKSSAWVMAYADKDTTFTRNGAYGLDPRILFHLGYICVSPAMAVTVPGKDSDYAMAMLDAGQKPLDCGVCRKKSDDIVVVCFDCKETPDQTIKFVLLGPHDKAYGI